MDLIIHLFEVEHDQIGHFKQLVNNRVVATNKAVGIEAGMNAFFAAGAEPVAHELGLQMASPPDAVTPPPEAFIKWR